MEDKDYDEFLDELVERHKDKTKEDLDVMANKHIKKVREATTALHCRALPEANEEQITLSASISMLELVLNELTTTDLDAHIALFNEYVQTKMETPQEQIEMSKTVEPENFKDLLGLNHD